MHVNVGTSFVFHGRCAVLSLTSALDHTIHIHYAATEEWGSPLQGPGWSYGPFATTGLRPRLWPNPRPQADTHFVGFPLILNDVVVFGCLFVCLPAVC